MKRFLYMLAAIYLVAAIVGLGLFKSPGYSKTYLAKHREAHERHHEIMKDKTYKAFIERPHLYPATPQLLAEKAFMEEYEANPEFQAEKRRIFAFTMYFRALNSGMLIALLVRGLKGPLTGFLDKKMGEIRTELADAQKAKAEAEKAKAEAEAKMREWSSEDAALRKQTEATVARQLAEIHRELEESQAQLAKETADRKLAEAYQAERTIKQELVLQALAALEQRYRTQATQEQLALNVEKFARFMDKLA